MPDEQMGWRNFAVTAGDKIIEEEKIDLLFSTSPPETAHLIARRLKRLCKIPWVADLRDLWADDHFRPRRNFKKIVLRIMEKTTLKDADLVVTVSRPWAEKLQISTGRGKDRVRTIENGYDEEDFNALTYTNNHKLTIAYTGKLHKDYQDVSVFFKVLKEMIDRGRISRDRIAVRFYIFGYDKQDIAGMAASFGLDGIVTESGRVGYMESLGIQRGSDALLFVQWQGEGGDGWYSAKLYDYLGARRPILALAKKDGIIDDLIKKSSSGIVAESEHDIRRALSAVYDEYLKTGTIRYRGDDKEVSMHTRRHMTGILADLLDSVMHERGA